MLIQKSGFTGRVGANCRLAEKEVLAGLIVVGDHWAKDNKWFLGYARIIIRYLNHIKPSE